MTTAGAAPLGSSESGPWPLVRLGEVLTHRREFIRIDDAREYVRCRVQLHAKGIVLRDRVEGALVKTKDQQVCRTGEFLVAEIDAKVGGFGIVPAELDGSIVSSHYFLFAVDPRCLDQRFLDYYSKTRAFRDQVRAQGSTNYAAIRPGHVLGYTIPLPPLSEQRRIVGKLDYLATKLAEARNLQRSNAESAAVVFETTCARIMTTLLAQGTIPISEAVTFARGRFSHRPRNDPHFFGGSHPWIQIAEIESARKYVRSWSATLNDQGLAISRKFPRGAVLISIAATIGAVAILDFDSCVPDSVVAALSHEGTRSEFLYYYLSNLRSHLEDIAPQSAQKNINLRILSDLPFPRVTEEVQHGVVRQLDALADRISALSSQQELMGRELTALMPAILDQAFRGEL
jgi:type I restriction enzyme S subunit